MMESLKTRLEFPSPVIQAQTVRSLVAAVVKEKGSDGQITWSCAQGPALEALWQQCCSDCAVVCSACCDTLVLLVDQGHADLEYILNGVLNLLPSARHTQGLIKVIRRLLEMQADQSDGHFTCPYSIR
ncbi:splicing factor U2AF 65 kDa subunit [Sarotherodon galilaeus]